MDEKKEQQTLWKKESDMIHLFIVLLRNARPDRSNSALFHHLKFAISAIGSKRFLKHTVQLSEMKKEKKRLYENLLHDFSFPTETKFFVLMILFCDGYYSFCNVYSLEKRNISRLVRFKKFTNIFGNLPIEIQMRIANCYMLQFTKKIRIDKFILSADFDSEFFPLFIVDFLL